MTSVSIVSNHLKEVAASHSATEESIIQSWRDLWENGIEDDILILDTTFLDEDEEYGGYKIQPRSGLTVDGNVYSVMEMMNVQMSKLLNSGKTIIGILSDSRLLKDKPNHTIAWDNYHWLPFTESAHYEGDPSVVPIESLSDPSQVKCDLDVDGLDQYLLNAGWTNISIDPDDSNIESYQTVCHYNNDRPHAKYGYELPAGIVVDSWKDSTGEIIQPDGELVLLPKPFSLKIDVEDWFSSLIEVGAAFSSETVGHDQLRRIIGRSDSEALQRVYRISERLPEVERQLQNRYNSRQTISIDDEYDLQDLYHGLLKLYFNDVREEEWAPSYGGTSPRIDFLIKQETVAVELKITRSGRTNSDIKTELAEDKEHYRAHPDCECLVCYIYDPEYRMDNPVGFEEDLSEDVDDLSTEVIVSSSNRFGM